MRNPEPCATGVTPALLIIAGVYSTADSHIIFDGSISSGDTTASWSGSYWSAHVPLSKSSPASTFLCGHALQVPKNCNLAYGSFKWCAPNNRSIKLILKRRFLFCSSSAVCAAKHCRC
jgi:hypothetical protein